MKLSLMKRQFQNDYTNKVKYIIQHLVLTDPNFKDKSKLIKQQQTNIRIMRQQQRKARKNSIGGNEGSPGPVNDVLTYSSIDQKGMQNGQSNAEENIIDTDLGVPPLWDTEKMREILKQHIPLGELVLDDEFFRSKTMRDFQPAMDIDEFYENCQELYKIISDEPVGNPTDSVKDFGSRITKTK